MICQGCFFYVSDFIKLKYLGTVLICEDCIHEEIKSTLILGNYCYHLVQNLLSSHVLSNM